MMTMMRTSADLRCLILACGNTLRGDDGVGPWLCDRAAERFADEPGVRTIARQQWTPDLAKDIAQAETVLFIDCCVLSSAGAVELTRVLPAAEAEPSTHHLDAAQLLALARDLFAAAPRWAMQMTIGAGSTDFAEGFSAAVDAALPDARALLERAVHDLLQSGQRA